jgi:hypothetical protein
MYTRADTCKSCAAHVMQARATVSRVRSTELTRERVSVGTEWLKI